MQARRESYIELRGVDFLSSLFGADELAMYHLDRAPRGAVRRAL